MEQLSASSASELTRLFARARMSLSLRERDPLTYWHFRAPQTREAALALREVDELYLRGPNKGGKTEMQYAVALACLQGREALDGVPLPRWRGRIDAVSLELDHVQQELSSQQTLMRLIGDWPKKVRKVGDAISSITVKPINGSSDESTWNKLQFVSQKNRDSGIGIRADIVLGNEPPRENIWRELRKAAHAGRRMLRIIGATPIIRRQWEWLKKDYGDSPRGVLTRRDNWLEARWSLYDSTALSPEEIAALVHEYRTDPLAIARIYGDYVDVSGEANPFALRDGVGIKALNEMLEKAHAAARHFLTWECTIVREVQGEEGLEQRKRTVPVLVHEEPKDGQQYYLNVDPSRGIEMPGHDPGAILVSKMGSGDDVAMYEGYIGSYGLGRLAAILARQYNNAVVDPESNSGWAEGVQRGLQDAGYGNLARTRVALDPEGTRWETRFGFITNKDTRHAMIAADQAWVQAWVDREPYANCPFPRVIETFLDTILDQNGKAVAAPGYHDEFLILKGQSLRKTMPVKPDENLVRHIVTPGRTPGAVTFEDLMKTAANGRTPNGHAPRFLPKSSPK